MAKRTEEILRLNPSKNKDLLVKIEKIRKLTGKDRTGRMIKVANEQSLAWIQKEAADNLERAIATNKRPPFRSGKLREAILNPKMSQADGRGIKFMVDALVRPTVPYYAALEYGDNSQVNQERWFSFLGTGSAALSANRVGSSRSSYTHSHPNVIFRSNDEERGIRTGHTDRIIGPRENVGRTPEKGEKRHKVRIGRPIKPYRYGTDAGVKFVSSHIYNDILTGLVGSSGLSEAGVKYISGH